MSFLGNFQIAVTYKFILKNVGPKLLRIVCHNFEALSLHFQTNLHRVGNSTYVTLLGTLWKNVLVFVLYGKYRVQFSFLAY